MTNPTRVVNIKHEEYDVYIGRAMPGLGLAASVFANKFKVGRDGDRPTVLRKYREYAKSSPEIMGALESLRGRRIGCFCKPRDCHGDILVELLGEKPVVPPPPAQAVLF